MKTLFNDGWRFAKTKLDGDNPVFSPVDLPHDWLIYQTKDLYEDSMGWYEKKFLKPEGEYVSLRFDGVYMDSVVFVNGHAAKEWKYGYSTFDVELTPYLTEGENTVRVKVHHQSPNSRWYSGAGIYRNVWLKTAPTLHLIEDGVYFSSVKTNDGYAAVLSAEVSNAPGKDEAQIWYFLAPKGGSYELIAKSEPEAEITVSLPTVKQWSMDLPNLYSLKTQLVSSAGDVLDETECTVGFRTMCLHPDKGLLINGERVKLHGVCEHHDLGCLGAAFNRAAMERKFRILRDMGANAIRTSHNMPAPEMMELADEYGFVIVSEAFDMWEGSKTEYDYGRFFKEWAETDVRSWIRRDRNHPSVMLWSIGNEIYDTHAGPRGMIVMKRLMKYVEDNDPRHNATVTFGSNYMPWENTQKCADVIKVAGYNYAEKYYREHHKAHPDWIIYGSETSSIVQSRGVYHFPADVPCLSDEDEQCSSLGNSITSWGARKITKCIADDRDADFTFGMFIWTGFDYIGEPTPYHTKNSYFGQIDTAGFPKDAYYIYKAEWSKKDSEKFVHLFPYWDFSEGEIIDVMAASNASAVELFVNGLSYGKRCIDHSFGTDQVPSWKVVYTPGEITAVAYDESGNEAARTSRHSFGDSKSIVLVADKTQILANGEDLAFITIQTADENGYPVENAMDRVSVSVEGEGRLLGMDNGDSTDYDEYKTNVRKLFNGKLLAVVASTKNSGDIVVTVRGEGLNEAKLTIKSVPADVRCGISCNDLVPCSAAPSGQIHVRRIDISAESTLLTGEKPSVTVCAKVLPENATDKSVIWQAVNRAGIEVSQVKIEDLGTRDGLSKATLTALGDGEIAVRALSKDGSDGIKIISRLELKCEGIGAAFIDPYEFVSAGLLTRSIGDLAGGNEKGVAFSREAVSTAIFDDVNFGEFGSDEIELPIFALSDEEYPVEIWEGTPEDGELLTRFVYQKPSIWNTYQSETVKLSRRLKGITTISISSPEALKFHLKGFVFTRLQKAYSRLTGADCTKVYGDSFTRAGDAILDIGNNVTIEYDEMDFSEGAAKVLITGSTPLDINTIHLHFVTDGGELVNNIIEFKKGSGTQSFEIGQLTGKGRIELVFLPGSSFDFESIKFTK